MTEPTINRPVSKEAIDNLKISHLLIRLSRCAMNIEYLNRRMEVDVKRFGAFQYDYPLWMSEAQRDFDGVDAKLQLAIAKADLEIAKAEGGKE